MCLILFAWKAHPEYRLVLAANRDEFYERPTKNAGWWEDYPEVLGGRDLKAGGTWMGVTKSGKFAAITNYRQFPITEKYETSRGDLVKTYLTGNETPREYFEILQQTGEQYEGFNLLFGNYDELYYFSNRGDTNRQLGEGIYGLSNHLLDTPWPKVSKGKKALKELLEHKDQATVSYFELLKDTEIADNSLLPDTGIGLEKERWLSSMFIKSPGYGTRSSYILMVGEDGSIMFSEKGYVPESRAEFELKL